MRETCFGGKDSGRILIICRICGPATVMPEASQFLKNVNVKNRQAVLLFVTSDIIDLIS